MFFCFSHLIFFSYSLFSLRRSVVLLPCLVIGSAFDYKKSSIQHLLFINTGQIDFLRKR